MIEKEIRKFRRASAQRLITAKLLLKLGLYLDSVYIAGYVVECSLKALILARCPRPERESLLKAIATGRRGHDFEFLKSILKNQGCLMPPEIATLFGRIATWSTSMRYDVGLGDPEEAEGFLLAAEGIRDWVERSL